MELILAPREVRGKIRGIATYTNDAITEESDMIDHVIYRTEYVYRAGSKIYVTNIMAKAHIDQGDFLIMVHN